MEVENRKPVRVGSFSRGPIVNYGVSPCLHGFKLPGWHVLDGQSNIFQKFQTFTPQNNFLKEVLT
jgi:hypothetical protein